MENEDNNLREDLTEAGIDWDTARIIVHFGQDEDGRQYSQGCFYDARDIACRKFIELNDPVLDMRFEHGYGGAEMPSFVAEDKTFLYFPTQYDGATAICKIAKDINYYLSDASTVPYP